LLDPFSERTASKSSSMTTFTRIPDSETATITVDARHRIAKINDNIYGGFTESVEHMHLMD
jgi:hypothetical protein